MQSTQDQNFEAFLNRDLSDYEGEWVAIKNGEVKLSSKNERRLRKQALSELETGYVVTKIPDSNQSLVV